MSEAIVPKWGNISEREALAELIEIIRDESLSKAEVTKQDIDERLVPFIRRKNPGFSITKSRGIATNIRGWLNSRYTMFLPTDATKYVEIRGLLDFMNEFDRTKSGGAYSFRTRQTRLRLRLEGLP